MESVRIRSFSCPYFSACRLNTERYGVSFGMARNTDQKDLIEVFLGKGVLKICSKCTEEHPYRAKESLPSSLLHVFIMGNSVSRVEAQSLESAAQNCPIKKVQNCANCAKLTGKHLCQSHFLIKLETGGFWRRFNRNTAETLHSHKFPHQEIR